MGVEPKVLRGERDAAGEAGADEGGGGGVEADREGGVGVGGE